MLNSGRAITGMVVWSDREYLAEEKQKAFDVMDTFIPANISDAKSFFERRSSEIYVITDMMDWAKPEYLMNVSWLFVDERGYLEERDMYYKNFMLDKDCFSPEEVDRINFDAFIEYK